MSSQNSLGINFSKFDGSTNTISTIAIGFYNATAGSTVTGLDFVSGIIVVNPTSAQAIATPTASLIDAALLSIFGSFSALQSVNLRWQNRSLFDCVITAGANCTFGPGTTTFTIPANGNYIFQIVKSTSSPSYVFF